MPKQNNPINLTNKEMDILNVLWTSEKPLTASEITKFDESLSANTVQANLRKLQSKEFIEVADIVYSGTVLCRRYKPTISKNDFVVKTLNSYFDDNDSNISISAIVSALLKTKHVDEDTLDELQNMLDKWKSNLKGSD